MTKQINPTDIFELARSTGRSPPDIYNIVQQEGWEIVEDAAPMPTLKAERKSVMHDPKGAIELMRQLKEDNIKKLYKNDLTFERALMLRLLLKLPDTPSPSPLTFSMMSGETLKVSRHPLYPASKQPKPIRLN